MRDAVLDRHGAVHVLCNNAGGGDEGHVVNTSSGNGGIAPLPGTPIYALTKSAVVTLSESLYAQLTAVGARAASMIQRTNPTYITDLT